MDGVKAAAVDLSTKTLSVGVVQSSWRVWARRRRRMCRHSQRQAGRGESVDRDGVSGCGAVEPTTVVKAATVVAADLLTEMTSMRRRWICRH